MCVFCTVAPNATDAEHSLTTLRTGFLLSGRSEKDFSNVKKQSDLAKFALPPPKRVLAMNKWSADQVAEWLAEQGIVGAAKGTTGAMLVKMAETRMVQICGGKEKLGKKVYAAMKAEQKDPKRFFVE